MPIFCSNCIEGNILQSKEFYVLSHGTIQCIKCKTKYLIKVDKIIIVDETR